MTETREQKVKMNTPKAVARWPKLHQPDFGTAQHPKPDGEYSVKLLFNESDPAFVKFREKLQPYMDAARELGEDEFAKLKKAQRDNLGGAPRENPVFTPLFDDNDEPTGQFEMKLTMKAGGVIKRGPKEGQRWNRKPDMFDALGRKIAKPVEIWGGSDLICSFSFFPTGYFIPATGRYGLKLSLEAVQIVTLRQGGEKSAGDYGFGAVEDGFDSSMMAPEGDTDGAGDDDLGSDDDSHIPSGDPAGAAGF